MTASDRWLSGLVGRQQLANGWEQVLGYCHYGLPRLLARSGLILSHLFVFAQPLVMSKQSLDSLFVPARGKL
jgi:hypothetical protein